MSKTLSLLRMAAMAVVAIGASTAAFADPPGRVGRLSYTEGTVSFHTADQDQWSPAAINYPVVAGTSFWTEPQSRAEIQVGSAEIRLDETTAIDVIALDDRATQLQVQQGVINVHLRRVPGGGVQVLTPNGRVDLIEPGSYNINVGQPSGDAPPPQTQVTALEGKAEVAGERSRLEILPGETAAIGGNPVNFTLYEGNTTPFDDWALARERREVALDTSHYVSPEATGYQDLDDYGTWASDPNYGALWYPTAVAADWAPYRYGHWAYVVPWGWTWIDEAPWGFTPFHYGRWVQIDGVWAWAPGRRVARPVYAPALVAFIGGAGWGVSLSESRELPAVGWVPLAPHEVYHPYYPTSVTYVRNVNITSVNQVVVNRITTVNVTNTTVVTRYANHQGTTVVPAAAFTSAAPVHRATLAVPHEQLAQVAVARTITHLQPSPAARAATPVPAAAEAVVPHPNVPARVVAHPVTATFVPPGHEPSGPPGHAEFVPPGHAQPGPPGQAGVAPPAREQASPPGQTGFVPPGHREGVPSAGVPPVPQQTVVPTVPPQTHGQPGVPPPPAVIHGEPAAVPPPPTIHQPPGGSPPHGEAAHTPGPNAAPGPPVNPNIGRPLPPQVVHTAPTSAPPIRGQASIVPGPAVAPGPPINRPIAAAAPRPFSPPQQPNRIATPQPQPRLPPAQVERPVQQTRIAPTPRGWVRGPQSSPSPASAHQAPAHSAPPQHQPPARGGESSGRDRKPGN